MNQLRELMGAVGRKRFILLVIFLAVCAVLGGVWQKILLPQHQTLTAELNQVQSERSRLQHEIIELPIRHAALEETEKRYNDLRDRGFFVNQDRIEGRTRMSILRSKTKLHGINYKIEPQEKVDNPNFISETDQIVASKVSVEMRGLTDMDLLDFTDRMQNEFSGLVVLKGIKMKRDEEISEENLKKLSQGEQVDFTTGEANFAWYSIIPKSSTVSTPLSQAFEGSSQ